MAASAVDPERPSLQPIGGGRSLVENAADRIREQLLAGGYRQGEHLVEAKIADELGISRGPVREAFRILRVEGLVTEEPRRGTFVVTITPQDVREIYGLRAAVEGAAVRSLCRKGDPHAVAQLEAAIAEIAAASSEGDTAGVARADVAFHELLCRLSGNRRLLETFQRYVPMLRGLLRWDEEPLGTPVEGVAEQHRPLVAAIRNGDEMEAVRLVTSHSEEAGERLAQRLESSL